MRSDATADEGGLLKVVCPKCGERLRDDHNRVRCQGCDFGIWKIIAGRQFRTSELEELISRGKIGPFEDFRGKLGRRFVATIKLTAALKVEFVFNRSTPVVD